MITPHEALIYTMVLVSAADREMPDRELELMGDLVAHLPVFRGFDRLKITKVGAACARLLAEDDGLDRTLEEIKIALPKKLHETAYALACEVAAADGKVGKEEARVLELIRHRLDVGRLPAAAIERAAWARYATL